MNRGVTCASFSLFGKIPDSIDMFIIFEKSCGTQSKIILQDNDNIVTKNVDVAEVFNKFVVNVAQDIGKDYTFNKNDHPSF
jgi:hypothetical protein